MFLNIAKPFALVPFWLNHSVHVWKPEDNHGQAADLTGTMWQVPLRFSWDEENWWNFPIDPVISISGGNTIVRQNCLKQPSDQHERRGSIKEVWGQNDYEIQIGGILSDADDEIPYDDLVKLRAFCEERKTVYVECDLFEPFNIQRIAIHSYEFQHTAGRGNQTFTIKAYSDDDFSLLIQ